jgi:transcriptional regulator with XRE-family HTH domain
MPAGRPPTKEAPAFGQRLAALRKERGWTQPQLAEQLGVSVKAITYYEREASNPTTKTVEQIAEVFGVAPADLIAGQNARPQKRKSGPPSRLEQIFDRISELPRSKQQVVADMLEGFLDRTG